MLTFWPSYSWLLRISGAMLAEPFWSAELVLVREPEEPFWRAELVLVRETGGGGTQKAILKC